MEAAAETPLHAPLAALGPVHLEVVRAAAAVAQWNATVARWHPLGFKGAFGYRLRYFISAGEQRLGCLLLAGAARAWRSVTAGSGGTPKPAGSSGCGCSTTAAS